MLASKFEYKILKTKIMNFIGLNNSSPSNYDPNYLLQKTFYTLMYSEYL